MPSLKWQLRQALYSKLRARTVYLSIMAIMSVTWLVYQISDDHSTVKVKLQSLVTSVVSRDARPAIGPLLVQYKNYGRDENNNKRLEIIDYRRRINSGSFRDRENSGNSNNKTNKNNNNNNNNSNSKSSNKRNNNNNHRDSSSNKKKVEETNTPKREDIVSETTEEKTLPENTANSESANSIYCNISPNSFNLDRLRNITKSLKLAKNSETIFSEGEARHVIFAKVHKAAGSTIANILMRFALPRNLSLMLPDEGTCINEFGPEINEKLFPPLKDRGGFYDILSNPVTFNEDILAPYFPPDAVRITIFREPMRQALSALRYYAKLFPSQPLMNGLKKHPDDPINGFLKTPTDFCDMAASPMQCRVNNRQSLDLGMSAENFESAKRDPGKICEFVRKLDRQFELVMIADLFQESLVLLKRMLHWQWKDIIYVKINSLDDIVENFETSVWSKKPIVTPEVEQMFRKWAAVDYAVYSHFLNKFLKTAEHEVKFCEEVKSFKTTMKEIEKFCKNERRELEKLTIRSNEWTKEFVVSLEDCKLMTMSGNDFENLWRKTHRGRSI